ncbi:hypothetical protein CAPTEDRAFT_187778 [Capitella teleta]|uniref:Uncharacterized protein n=1 Tax=Capitella teleta TaxID=283909 RepID=R7T4Q5_CAPTE|nr:hypothetical protein CAPTEDRAFT_187778 [Capitella teleta]|eukprot:ELT88057.1 hypothetical protein CAPTEDRAFT_187778 [Capitella teleta]
MFTNGRQNVLWTMWSCRDTSTEGCVCEMVTDCPSSGHWTRFRINKCFHLAKTSDEVNYFHAQGLCQQQYPNDCQLSWQAADNSTRSCYIYTGERKQCGLTQTVKESTACMDNEKYGVLDAEYIGAQIIGYR